MAMEIDLGEIELPKNILKFGYSINYKYVGKVSHSFDRFYVVTKFELPKVEDLQFDDIPYDAKCAHLDNPKPYYNQMATDILTNELALILPTFLKQNRQKRGIITSLIMGFIGLAYEGISSFIHHKRQKALQKAVHAIVNRVDLQCNKIFHLEDSMVMYGVYTSDTLEDLTQFINCIIELHGMKHCFQGR